MTPKRRGAPPATGEVKRRKLEQELSTNPSTIRNRQLYDTSDEAKRREVLAKRADNQAIFRGKQKLKATSGWVDATLAERQRMEEQIKQDIIDKRYDSL
jgi:hypothetical protein